MKYNKIAYLGNFFPIEIIIEAKKFKGSNVNLRIMHEGKTISSQNVNIESNSFIKQIPIKIEAEKSGLQKYSVQISGLAKEASKQNNYRNVYIDILDSRQKIVVLHGAPHPDISAIKTSIASNENYQVESFPVEKFNKSIKGYNLVILHGLPSANQRAEKIFTEIENAETPILFIFSSQTYIPLVNKMRRGLNINQGHGGVNEVKAAFNQDFSLFTLDENLRKDIDRLPPLSAPFGDYSGYISSHVLFKQQIGSISSSMPLIVFGQDKENKTGFIAAEGLWRWKLANFKFTNNHEAFNELISKIVQYLCIKVDKSLFRVKSKNTFNENENIEFTAELYNESYELINKPEMHITIFDQDKRYPYVFRKTSNAYHLNAGSFPPGEYSYIAKVMNGGKEYLENGIFTVKEMNIESINTLADHHLLYNLAEKTGGKLVYPEELNTIPSLLNQREDIVSVSYPQKTFREIIHIPYILGAILFILSLEWFIRKWKGGY